MVATSPQSSALRRVLAGAAAGGVLGFIVEGIWFSGGTPQADTIDIPTLGPAIGCAVSAVVAIAFGGLLLRGVAKDVAVGTILGVIAGVLLGASAFPGIMAYFDIRAVGVWRSKVFDAYRHTGIILGIPVGAVVGVIGGLTYSVVRSRHRRSATR
jgi:hypothetical protein